MYEKITPEFVRECTFALEFYDDNGILPWETKRIDVTLTGEALAKLSNVNRSKVINDLVVVNLSDRKVLNTE
jgi:hypothetical protein